MKAATRRRAISRVTLLARSNSRVEVKDRGKVKLCQSSDEPLRTIRALVNAANIIVMAIQHYPDAGRSRRRRVVLRHAQVAIRRNQIPPAAVSRVPSSERSARFDLAAVRGPWLP